MARRRPGLWVEIGLNLALLTAAVSLLDAGVFYVVTQHVLRDAASELAEDTSAVLTAELTAAGSEGWKRVIDTHRRAGTRDLTLYSPSGVVLAGTNTPAGPEVRAAFFAREVSVGEAEGLVEVVAPVGSPGPPTAVLRLRLPVTTTATPSWVFVIVHAAFSTVLIALFGLVLFRGSVLRPLEQMRDGTRKIAAGDLGLQVPEDAPAELSELAAALNAMSTALAGYRERTAEQLARLEAANAELRRTQDALLRSEKLASVGRLAAGLAHELGNPLAAVRGYVELLAMGDSALSGELVSRCGVEVERMHNLLRGLLDFARTEVGEEVVVDARGLLEEAVRTVRLQGPFRSVALEVVADGAPAIRGEPAKLHQVLVNLLLNAAGAGAQRITLSARSSAGEVVLACTDDGEGIAPEHLPRLFEPFFTTRPPGKGTGLGLAVAHHVVEQHGGRIEVASVIGKGSTFSLHFRSPDADELVAVRRAGSGAADPVSV